MPQPGPALSTAMLDAAVEMIGRAGLRGSVQVAGVSMHPTFDGVGRLAVEFSPEKIAFGDVLVFRQRGKLVVHRLVHRSGGRLRTRGDGTISFDPWLDPADVIGRVFAVEYTDGAWRGIHGGRARLYAWKLALHGLFWGGLGYLAVRLGSENGQWRLGRVDRFVLGLGHALFFRAFNPRVPAPDLDVASGGAEARCYTRSFDRSDPGKKPNKQ